MAYYITMGFDISILIFAWGLPAVIVFAAIMGGIEWVKSFRRK